VTAELLRGTGARRQCRTASGVPGSGSCLPQPADWGSPFPATPRGTGTRYLCQTAPGRRESSTFHAPTPGCSRSASPGKPSAASPSAAPAPCAQAAFPAGMKPMFLSRPPRREHSASERPGLHAEPGTGCRRGLGNLGALAGGARWGRRAQTQSPSLPQPAGDTHPLPLPCAERNTLGVSEDSFCRLGQRPAWLKLLLGSPCLPCGGSGRWGAASDALVALCHPVTSLWSQHLLMGVQSPGSPVAAWHLPTRGPGAPQERRPGLAQTPSTARGRDQRSLPCRVLCRGADYFFKEKKERKDIVACLKLII